MKQELEKIYGVTGLGKIDPTLTRTDDACGLTYTRGTQEIFSDFDRCYPWSDITEVRDRLGNVFVRIPRFYSRVTENSDGTLKMQISGVRHAGFSTLFIDGEGNELEYVLVGKYHVTREGDEIYSFSQRSVAVSRNITWFRNAAKRHGEGYQIYDFLIDAVIKQLFTVEFATTNSQSVMMGYSTGAALVFTGRTDSVRTASGSERSNDDNTSTCKYRGIENPWGNAWTLTDGINFQKEKIYLCFDPDRYACDTYTAPYFYAGDRVTQTGIVRTEGLIGRGCLLLYPKAVGGYSMQYYSDKCYYSDVGTVLRTGSASEGGTSVGIWGGRADYASNLSGAHIGTRLCYKPIRLKTV